MKHLRLKRWLALAALLAATQSCSGGGGSDAGFSPASGVLVPKPEGGFFVADPHRGGKASRVRLLEMGWGRLVSVHDVDEQGRPSAVPVLRDVVIGENVLSNGVDLRLETNPVTHESRLIVLHPRDAPDTGEGTFESALQRATRFGGIKAKNSDGTSSLPVTVVARDAVLVLRFDDLLQDDLEAGVTLPETVRLVTGYPPRTGQPARTIFDPSHGGIAGGRFHSTRVLVDCTVSGREAAALPYFREPNASGLPASSPFSPQPNVSVRIPTRTDPATGHFVRLVNLAGRGLEVRGPVDQASGEIVRAFRSGNREDINTGFLLDLQEPSILGTWDVIVEHSAEHPDDLSGFGFLLDLAFPGPCRASPRSGDTLLIGGDTYEVASGPDDLIDGRASAVHVVRLEPDPVQPGLLLGLGSFSTPYRGDGRISAACWVTFVPDPSASPAAGIDTDTHIVMRFSEPMEPTTFRAFDTFRILRGAEGGAISAQGLVVGEVEPSKDLQEFRFRPRLPFANVGSLDYRVELVGGLEGVLDFSGTPLAATFGRAKFTLASGQLPESNGGFALRFQSNDELDPPGLADLRGQVSFDEDGGILRPRPLNRASYTCDRGNDIPNLMKPWAFGVQTPLSPLGSKLQAVWRYVDFGIPLRDERFFNLDVIGMSWSPLGGSVIADHFPLFEMLMAHGKYLPDETFSGGATKYRFSGLLTRPSKFVHNVLSDPRNPQVVVHPRSLGYVVRPSDLFRNPRGTPLLPYPWNRSGGPLTTFTWRDTTVLATGGERSSGVPMDIEVGPPIFSEPEIAEVAEPGFIPSIGLPLLWEIRCFPTSSGLGFNSHDIFLPVLLFSTPYFRAFSTGGIDVTGREVAKNPDRQETPSGGFNPNSNPPGKPTPLAADSSFYVGQIDTVARVSRVVTAWIDTGGFQPQFVAPVIEPSTQPGSSSILMEFRGATGFSDDAGLEPFDAQSIDAYGEFSNGMVFHHRDGLWREGIESVNGARFVQMRLSFISDLTNDLSPELDSLGIAFRD